MYIGHRTFFKLPISTSTTKWIGNLLICELSLGTFCKLIFCSEHMLLTTPNSKGLCWYRKFLLVAFSISQVYMSSDEIGLYVSKLLSAANLNFEKAVGHFYINYSVYGQLRILFVTPLHISS